MNSLEDNKAVVRTFLQALGTGDVAALSGLLTPDVEAVCTGSSMMAATRGHADMCAAAGMLGRIAPGGIALEVVSLTAEDDRVSCEVQGRSTLVNGAAYDNQYHFLFTLREGRIARLKEYMDSKLVDDVLGPLVRAAAAGA